VLEYLRQYGGDLGVALSLAPFSETRLVNGARILNLITYLAENLKNWREGLCAERLRPVRINWGVCSNSFLDR